MVILSLIAIRVCSLSFGLSGEVKVLTIREFALYADLAMLSNLL
ncbi:hypothetical protein [uncultured Clostridium sp.]|nr:hypothetical protein [uncultured Clostridium sp.]